MAVSVFVFSIIVFSLPIISTQIDQAVDIHYRYMIERSTQTSITSAFEKENVNHAFEEFKSVFLIHSPEGFEYIIKLQAFELEPKLMRFTVEAIHDKGYEYIFDETLIEEAK